MGLFSARDEDLALSGWGFPGEQWKLTGYRTKIRYSIE
jgi:hypothetical protein